MEVTEAPAVEFDQQDASFPRALGFLFDKARYKVAYGGRGGSKSWGFARALLIRGHSECLRVLCARETMKAISESVHQLLTDQIQQLGMQGFYQIEKARIYGANGTEFTFAGLRHNVQNIKSAESIDVCWVEEANNVSRDSWQTLIPTIRKDGSEIWVSFNPEWEDDYTYQLFVLNPPPGAIVKKLTYRDNPWFPKVLEEEMVHLKSTDPDAYNHVYEGLCISLLSSAIYANELRAVDREGRIANIKYDPSRPVDCYWDLGYGDMTAIWMVQSFPFEHRLIDYIEESARPLNWYLTQMQNRGYLYGTDWLPWDIGLHAAQMGSGKSIEELMRLAGRKVRITPKLTVADGINAARTVFPVCWFDRNRCEDGIKALRHYRFGEVQTVGHVTREPLHDRASHGCLTGDSLVQTASGARRIDEIQVGERVWTPAGYATVSAAGPTKQVSELIEIRTAAGSVLHCTPEHKVFTPRGLVHAGELMETDLVLSGHEWNIRLLSLFSRAANIGFRATITGGIDGPNEDRRIFTEPSGNPPTGLFQRALKYTTGTVTLSTTISPTLRFCPQPSISATIPALGSVLDYSLLQRTNAAAEPQNGTDPNRGASGISGMAETPGRNASGWRSVVSNAVSRFARLILRAPSGATGIARLTHYAPAGGSQWVYDLTVERHACYQANGLLVSNSDAFRYFAVCAKPPKPKLELVTPRRKAGGGGMTVWS